MLAKNQNQVKSQNSFSDKGEDDGWDNRKRDRYGNKR